MGWGLSLSGLRPDQIRTLVSTAADSSHSVIMGNLVATLVSSFLIGSSLFLQFTRTIMKSQLGLKFGKIELGTEKLAAPERLKKIPIYYNGRNVVIALVPSFWDESSPFLQVTRTTIKA